MCAVSVPSRRLGVYPVVFEFYRMPLTDQAKALLQMAYRVGAPRFADLSVTQARRSFQKLQFAFRPDAEAVASTTEVPMLRRDGSALLGRYYRPVQCGPEEVLGLFIFLHGGGWCIGDVESYDVLCRQICNESGCAVLSVDYRLAPEHPFPSALQDVRLAVEWAVAHAGVLSIDKARIALGGDSAGGNLAIVTALDVRNRKDLPLSYLVSIYPCTQINSDRPSRQRYGDGYFLDRGSLEWFFSHYLPGGEGDDWRASPFRAKSVHGLPAMLMVTAEYDPLTDDCAAFAERVVAEGGCVELIKVPGMVHGFLTLGKLFPEANETVGVVAGALRRALSGTTQRA